MNREISAKNIIIGAGKPKICVSIQGTNEADITSEAKIINSLSSCELVEFRADYYTESSDFSKLGRVLSLVRNLCTKPLIFTYRSKDEGGLGDIPEALYYDLLKYVSNNGLAEFVDVEARFAFQNECLVSELKKNGTFVILSVHNFKETPSKEQISKALLDMQKAGADIVKAAYMPNSQQDVLNLISAALCYSRSDESGPGIFISMGDLGQITRTLGEYFGSAITFASAKNHNGLGQLSADDTERALETVHFHHRNRIFLAGFMGTGKSTVAKAFSAGYGMKVADLDSYIEDCEKMTVSDIFNKASEEAFRRMETYYLCQLLCGEYDVISLGGGTVLREENLQLIKNHGTVILLTASPQEIEKRLFKDDTRPLLKQNSGIKDIEILMKKREAAYNRAADYIIQTSGKPAEEICKEIVATLGFTR